MRKNHDYKTLSHEERIYSMRIVDRMRDIDNLLQKIVDDCVYYDLEEEAKRLFEIKNEISKIECHIDKTFDYTIEEEEEYESSINRIRID